MLHQKAIMREGMYDGSIIRELTGNADGITEKCTGIRIVIDYRIHAKVLFNEF